MAKKKRKKILRSPSGQYIFKTLLKSVFIVIVAASLLSNLFTQIISVVKYYGESMSPTLEDGQILIINKMKEIESGDIVAFYYNNNILVRRVAAMENQQITIDVFGKVSVNGNDLQEEYVENLTQGQCNIDFPYTVPPNSYFVLGDDREVSMDSRLEEIGTVSEDRIIGTVMFH